MLRHKLIFGVCLLIAALAACNRTPDISGTWNGQPSPLTATGKTADGTVANSQITTSFTFIPAKAGANDGVVELMSDITLIDAVPYDTTVIATYELNIAATATVTGTYRIEDDDEVLISLDMSTLKVTVDPDAVTYSENVLTGNQAPAIDSLKPAIAARYAGKLDMMVRNEYGKYTKLDDVKVHNDMLSTEIDHRDYTFRRNK